MKIQLAAILSLACASACFAAKEAPRKSGGAATAPVVWKLGPDGFTFDTTALKPMRMTRTADLPVVTMDKLG